MRPNFVLMISLLSCVAISGAILSKKSRETSSQPTAQPAPLPVVKQVDQVTIVNPTQVADRQLKAKNLLIALDAIEQSLSTALPKFEADKAEELVHLIHEYQATIPPIRAAANEGLSGDCSPELRQRFIALNAAFQEKGKRVQAEFVRYTHGIAEKREAEAANLGFQGIMFSTKPGDVEWSTPNSQLLQLPWGETRHWEITNLPNLAKLDIGWINGDLFEIVADYGPYVYDLGGPDAIVKRLTNRLGPAQIERKAVCHTRYTWSFPTVERRIVFEDKNLEEYVFSIVHTGREKCCQEQRRAFDEAKRAKAESRDAGF